MDFYVHDDTGTTLQRWEHRWANRQGCFCPLILAGIAAGAALIGAGVGVGGAAIANKKSGNKERIGELEASQAAGRLTAGDEMLLNAERDQLQRDADMAASQEAGILAEHGDSSGRGLATLAEARQDRTGDIASKAAERFAQAYGAEGQEKEDRKAIQRDRAVESVNVASEGISDAGSAIGSMYGSSGFAGKGAPDTSKMEPQLQTAVNNLWTARRNGYISDREYREQLNALTGGDAAYSSMSYSTVP